MSDRFDQTARFTARFDPEGFLAWLFPGFAAQLRFERWLDTRAAPMPGLANQTADTVAELFALHEVEPPWLLLLECQTEPDPEMFGRLLEQLGKSWREHRPDNLPGSRYQLVAAVVNLTGTPESIPPLASVLSPSITRGWGWPSRNVTWRPRAPPIPSTRSRGAKWRRASSRSFR